MSCQNKVLVLVEAYPNYDDPYPMAYVHSRNIEYIKMGFEVTVLSFSARSSYDYEGIAVIERSSPMELDRYGAIIAHAPNIRNHYRFFRQHPEIAERLVLFFHGHECLFINKHYPWPYWWRWREIVRRLFVSPIYDHLKTILLGRFMREARIRAVYVSEWMRTEAIRAMSLGELECARSIVVPNAINRAFMDRSYIPEQFIADFITIRPFDSPKYGLDLVVALAENNPEREFHVYGKGRYFKRNKPPANLKVFDQFIGQEKMPALLDKYRCAIMPTRLDAQGVMMCEMASYGMPIIVSDLSICREMLGEYSNVIFVPNEEFPDIDLDGLEYRRLDDRAIVDKFSPSKVCKEEIEFINTRTDL